MTALLLDVLKVAGLGLAVMFLWDVWQLVRKQSSAIDRDQTMLDKITDLDPEYEHISLEELNIIAIDTTDMAKQDAVLAFIDAWEKHHE